MKGFFKKETISLGFALFSMFFGAGNIIFPLAVGQFAGDKNLFAVTGLILTAAIMPIAGVIAMLLFNGSYKDFFGRLGKKPGFLLALFVISLLGPLGSTPRCIVLAYTTLKASFLTLSPFLFSLLACLFIFLCTVKKRRVLTLLGWIFTPLLLCALIAIILIGLFTNPDIAHVELSNFTLFLHGLKEGYNTMDLLAAFFFSSTILNILKMRPAKQESSPMGTALRGSLIGGLLLAAIYIGFSFIASFHTNHLIFNGKDELLALIILKIAGPYAGLLVCTSVALACLTTAIALICAFTDFVQKEVFKEKFRYEIILIGALALTCCISTFDFKQISTFLSPLLQICYPGLILLTFLNIAYRLKEIKPIKTPVFCAFTLSSLLFLVG